MMNVKKGLRVFILAALAPVLAGCDGSIVQSVSPVSSQIQISITPNTAMIASGGKQQFTAAVTGTSNTAVTFTASVGSISATGLLTAPTVSGSTPVSVTVIATAVADSTKTALALVTVTPTVSANPGNGNRAAPSGSWQPIGPAGGPITVLAADPNFPSTAYASSSYAGNGGLWKTNDNGVTWKTIITNTDLDQIAVADIQIVGGTIYVASTFQRFFKSTDNGVAWIESMLPFQYSIGAMAVDPTNPSTIYLSIIGQGLAKSTDSGDNWALLSGSPIIANNTLTGIVTHSPLTVDPRSGAVYYGTDHGLYVSSDGGMSWKQGTGFTGPDQAMLDVAVSPADSTHLFALASSMFNSFPDLYTSTDKGMTWKPLATGVDAERVMPDSINASTVYVYQGQSHAVYTSTNGGASFVPSDTGVPTYVSNISTVWGELSGAMLILPSTHTFLVAVPNRGVYQSVNAGQSWAFSSTGISSWFGMAVAFDHTVPTTIYFGAVNDGGLWKSTDNGTTWTRLYLGSISQISVDPYNSLHILAEDFDKGLVETQDGGSSWHLISFSNPNPNAFFISGISFNPLKSGTIYISVNDVNGGVLVSKDGGQSYAFMNKGLPTNQVISSVAVNPADSTMLFVGTEQGICKSTDGGATWSSKSPATVSLISVDAKSTPSILYGSAGIFTGTSMKSVDLGETWQALPSFQLIVADPSTANSLFSPNAWSADGGNTWQWSLVNGLGHVSIGEAAQFDGFVLAPSSPQILYMVSNTNALFRFVVGP